MSLSLVYEGRIGREHFLSLRARARAIITRRQFRHRQRLLTSSRRRWPRTRTWREIEKPGAHSRSFTWRRRQKEGGRGRGSEAYSAGLVEVDVVRERAAGIKQLQNGIAPPLNFVYLPLFTTQRLLKNICYIKSVSIYKIQQSAISAVLC